MKYLMIAFIAVSAMGCAAGPRTIVQKPAMESCTSGTEAESSGAPDGYISTVHVVALIAGLPSHVAERYALYAQLPDSLMLRFSAEYVSVWGALLPWEWGYRRTINADLHSLHGGDASQIAGRQAALQGLIGEYARSDTRQDDWKVGFLIHALEDSYTHVYQHGDSEQHAYGPMMGHLIERGDYAPDSVRENIDNYLLYIDALYAALDPKGRHSQAKNAFRDFVQEAVLTSGAQQNPEG